ncbi:hypothetical protein HY484_03780 [Candidatus Woesearchaeota archaeon]|nr:hypothetical protein [Candidatus Woesearchaeota archaeon]
MEPGNKHKSVVNAGKANWFALSAALDYLEFSRAENISLKDNVKELEATMSVLEEESERMAVANAELQDKHARVVKYADGVLRALNAQRPAVVKYEKCKTAHASLKPTLEKFVDAVAHVKGDIPAVDTTAAETVLATLPDALTHVARAYNTVRMNVAASHAAYQRVQDENAKLQLDYDEKVAELDVADKLFEAEAHSKDALLAEKSTLENKYAHLEKEKDVQRVAYDQKHADLMSAEAQVRTLNDVVVKQKAFADGKSKEADDLLTDNDVAKTFLADLVGRLDGIDTCFKTIAQGLRDKLAVCT